MGAIAYFVSPHGFGHAARACAVMAALERRRRRVHFELFTAVPEWFFDQSLPNCFTYHWLESDVGLVQRSSLEEDLDATAQRLDSAPLGDSGFIDGIARQLEKLNCEMLISDISPLGLVVAGRMGIPAALIENFTWDWIYGQYDDAPVALRRHALEMAGVFAGAGLRIQATPVCSREPGATEVGPVARVPRASPAEVRRLLQIPDTGSVVLLSMGGVGWNYRLQEYLQRQDRAWIIVPGGSQRPERRGRMLLLPFHSEFYHPDLVCASDLIVGKLGYSTVAEAYAAGSAFAFIARPRFPESPVLAAFVHSHLESVEIGSQEFANGEWFERVIHLLDGDRRPGPATGAEEATAAILEYAAM